MSRAIAITRNAFLEARERRIEVLRSTIVLGCGMALMLAGKALPF